MSAPILWIAVPFIAGVLILFFIRERIFSAGWAAALSTILALIALIFPIDTALLLGSISLKISPSVQFFGRSFELNTADGPLLAIIYGVAALWFFGTRGIRHSQSFRVAWVNDHCAINSFHRGGTVPIRRASARNCGDACHPITWFLLIKSLGAELCAFSFIKHSPCPSSSFQGGCLPVWKPAQATWAPPLKQAQCLGLGLPFYWLSSRFITGYQC